MKNVFCFYFPDVVGSLTIYLCNRPHHRQYNMVHTVEYTVSAKVPANSGETTNEALHSVLASN